MVRSEVYEKVKQWMYYFIIGIVSLIALIFLPMIGSTIGLGWNIPDTTVGWIVWVAVKLIIATINILIFHSFICQAKINIKDDPKYLEACAILNLIKDKKVIPRSPRKWRAQQYGRKGTMIFITSTLTVIALTQALLTFDWMAMLTYLFTIIMGIVFGILQMKATEEYWVDEFWQYAIMVRDEEAEKRKALETAQTDERAPVDEVRQTEEVPAEPTDVPDICDGVDSVLPTSDNPRDTGADSGQEILGDNNSVCSVLGTTDNSWTGDSDRGDGRDKESGKYAEVEETE